MAQWHGLLTGKNPKTFDEWLRWLTYWNNLWLLVARLRAIFDIGFLVCKGKD